MTKIKMVPAQSQDEPSITVFTDENGNVVGNAYTMSKDEVKYHLAMTKMFQTILAIGIFLVISLLAFIRYFPDQYASVCDQIEQITHTGKSAPDYVPPTDWQKHAPTEYTSDGRFCPSHACEGGYATKADYDAAHPEVAQQAADYDAQLLARRQAKAHEAEDYEAQQKADMKAQSQ